MDHMMDHTTCWEPSAPRPARCVHVCDGDTIHVDMAWRAPTDKAPRWLLVKCRLHGINTPELHAHDEETRENARACKKMLSELVLDKLVVITFVADKHRDPFGRSLVHVLLPAEEAPLSESTITDPEVIVPPGVLAHGKDINGHMLLHGPGTVSFYPN